MAYIPEENLSNWDFDCALLEDLPSLGNSFQWTQSTDSLPPPTSLSMEIQDSFSNADCVKEPCSRKRSRSAAGDATDSKAYKEKIRRDRLNDRFQELSSILEPGRPPKTDKCAILNDAVRAVIQLREEAQKLKESYNDLQEKVNELKAEKNELRDEKLKLKAEKEKLEQQMKPLSGFLHQPTPFQAHFAAPPQIMGNKMMPFVGYPCMPMWQFMPPTVVDTSEDHTIRPPVA